MDDFELEIQRVFLDEAKELLMNSEQCFLSLEKSSEDPAVIAEIFRLAHNLKGSAGAVGFTQLADFAHQLESFLLKIKNKELSINKEIVNLLLASNDHLGQSVDLLKENPGANLGGDALKAKLMEFTQGQAPMASATDPKSVSAHEAPVGSPVAPPAAEILSVIEKNLFVADYERKTNSVKPTVASDESIRVALNKIDELLNSVGELVIYQTVMNQEKTEIESVLARKTIDGMAKIIRDVQGLSMSLRMVPLKQTFQKMQRIVRDTSKELQKEVALEVVGEETEIDKTVLEQLGDPLVHLIRNAVDHGLEEAIDRLAMDKPPVGKIQLAAFQKSGQIVIEIRDDGRGLDPKKLIKKAIEKKILNPEAQLTDAQAYQLIFAPGFSTKEQVTDVSGRGVGMDVVKTNINNLQGDIEIETKLGAGTCFRIILPLTLAILEAMVVRLAEERYVIPLSQIREFFQVRSGDISGVFEKSRVLNLRGSTLPIYSLAELLRRPRRASDTEGVMIIVEGSHGELVAIEVDEIIRQQQVVIKNVGPEIGGFFGITGASILGDGRVAFILDMGELIGKRTSRKQIS